MTCRVASGPSDEGDRFSSSCTIRSSDQSSPDAFFQEALSER